MDILAERAFHGRRCPLNSLMNISTCVRMIYMSRGSTKKDSSISIAIVVAIVLIASVLLIVRPSPEHVAARSSDSLLSIEGVTRSQGVLAIERLDDVATSIPEPTGPIYEATLSTQGTLEEAQLTFAFGELDFGALIQEVVVYVFDRQTLSWESVPTFFDLDTQTVTADVEFSGSLLVGLGMRVL